MPQGTTMRIIQERRRLVVGVDENTDHFAARDPISGEIKGLEVELVKDIAEAITGNRENIQFKTVLTADKNNVVADGRVDLTASADSISCKRWNQVAFSTEYFHAKHQLMVRGDSDIGSKADLAGRTVCVTKGSSSIDLLEEQAPDAHVLKVDGRTDCLVALQEGVADAYLAHDTFLRAMKEQDSNMKILDKEVLADQHYGIAISKDRPDLVRFVNAVLQRMRDSGRLEKIYQDALHDDAPEAPPEAVYRDEGATR
jgi:polar amino acid transport system substrate-binding protein